MTTFLIWVTKWFKFNFYLHYLFQYPLLLLFSHTHKNDIQVEQNRQKYSASNFAAKHFSCSFFVVDIVIHFSFCLRLKIYKCIQNNRKAVWCYSSGNAVIMNKIWKLMDRKKEEATLDVSFSHVQHKMYTESSTWKLRKDFCLNCVS